MHQKIWKMQEKPQTLKHLDTHRAGGFISPLKRLLAAAAVHSCADRDFPEVAWIKICRGLTNPLPREKRNAVVVTQRHYTQTVYSASDVDPLDGQRAVGMGRRT